MLFCMEPMPDGWGIIYTLAIMKDKAIYSTTRLNKALSFLQREGFPIENKFINEEMGPYDAAIHRKAESFEELNLLHIEKVPKNAGQDDVDNNKLVNYYLDGRGVDFYNNELLPTIQKSLDTGYKMGLSMTLAKLKLKNTDLVKSVHQELHLDDNTEFIAHLTSNIQILEKRLKDDAPKKYCPRDLEILGASQFILSSLNKIFEKHLPGIDDRTGKNHVLFNSERFCAVISRMQTGAVYTECAKNEKCMMHKGLATRCKREIDMISHFLRAAEYNSKIYEIEEPIDPSKYEFHEYD